MVAVVTGLSVRQAKKKIFSRSLSFFIFTQWMVYESYSPRRDPSFYPSGASLLQKPTESRHFVIPPRGFYKKTRDTLGMYHSVWLFVTWNDLLLRTLESLSLEPCPIAVKQRVWVIDRTNQTRLRRNITPKIYHGVVVRKTQNQPTSWDLKLENESHSFSYGQFLKQRRSPRQ